MLIEKAFGLTRGLLGGFLLSGLAGMAAAKQAPAPAPQIAPGTILNDDSYLRAFMVFRTPVSIASNGEIKVALDPTSRKTPKPLPDFQTALPPADWMKPEFDDALWNRRRTPVEKASEFWSGDVARHTATVSSLIHMRWKFLVSDPSAANDLKLTLEYVGGVVVYLNGKELTRANLPAGPIKPDTLAEKYPDDLYVLDGNKMLQSLDLGRSIKEAYRASFDRRYRKLEGLALPANLLRKGVNVLAVEIHRAPINEAVITAQRTSVGGMGTMPGIWAFAGLKSIVLAGASGAGVSSNTTRPKGIQIWKVSPFETLTPFDYGDPGETLTPIVVHAVKNGVFSGRLAVSSDTAIKGLKIAVGAFKLTDGNGALPNSAVCVRYAEPAACGTKSWVPENRFDGLEDVIPAEIPVATKVSPIRETYCCLPIPRTGVTSGAVAPIWITIRVPKDAKPGQYAGTVTVSAEGLAATQVPLKLTVFDWALPDPKDFRTHTMGYVSAESEARHYGVPLWSDKNFELVGKSLALMAQINSRQVLMDMAINFYSSAYDGLDSNSQSLVRWIKQADGSFKYDFTVLDKYLDTVAKSIGKPLPLRFNCWDSMDFYTRWKENGEIACACATKVTLLDPVTGKLGELEQPKPGTEESYKFWKPVLDEVRKKVEARGWFDVTCLGHNQYCGNPTPEVFGVATRIWPESVWGITHHGCSPGVIKANGVDVQVRYAEGVWSTPHPTFRGYRDLPLFNPAGKKSRRGAETIWCGARTTELDSSPLEQLRVAPELRIMQTQDGGQMGADYFPVKKPNGGYGSLGNSRGGLGPHQNGTLALLAPGPDGAVTTERFEAYREGIQLAETVLFLEKALEDKKIGGDLAERVNKCLDERSDEALGFWGLGWGTATRVARDEKLLALAGEVAKNMEVK